VLFAQAVTPVPPSGVADVACEHGQMSGTAHGAKTIRDGELA